MADFTVSNSVDAFMQLATPASAVWVRFNSDGTITERTAANMRTDLGLVIGTDVQAYSANLATWSGVTPGTGVTTALAVNIGSAGAPVLFNGAGGTPSSITLTNGTSLPVATGISGLGTGVATALAVNTGSAGAFVVNGGALGTPSGGTLTNATGLPVASGISGLGTGVATALAVNTGSSGSFVIYGGALGTPSSGTLTNCTGLPASGVTSLPVEIGLAISDESTALTTGTGKLTFRMPHAMTLTAVRASVNTAPTGSTLIVDINEGGSTILSTKLSIDASEKTSTTAASAAVISDASLADDAEITIDIDQVGSSVAGAGLKVWLIGTR